MIIKDIIKSLAKKKTVKNGAWMYAMQVFNTIIPLLTLPYVSRVLGTTKNGVFAIALNLIGYLQVLVEYGFGMSATRKVALIEKSKEKVSHIFSNVLYSRLLLYFASTIVALVYIYIMRDDSELCLCVVALLLCLFGYVVQENWLFQGMQDMKYISIVSISGRIISVLLIFILVKTPSDIILYALLYSVSPFLSGLFGFVFSIIKYKLRLVKPRINDIMMEMKSGFYVFTTSISSKVFGAIGVTFLGMMASKDIVGCFSYIQKIPNIMMLAWTPISQVMYPIASKRMNESSISGKVFVQKIQRIVLPIFAAGATVIAVFSNPVIRIAFGDEYAQHSVWLIPLLIWVLLGINNNFLGVQTLLASGHDKEYSKCFQIGVICTIVINYLCIRVGGGTGASIAPVFSELVISILLYKQIKSINK